MKEAITVKLSPFAAELLDKFKQGTGLEDEGAVIQECIFAVHELLQGLKKAEDKTTDTIDAGFVKGIISTFQRKKSEYGD